MIRRLFPLLLVFMGLLTAAPGGTQQPGALVDVVQIDGVIDRQVADYLQDTIAKANTDRAELVAVELDTPGGLGVSADELIDTITASEVPVLAFVPPSSQATSAGAVVAQASHILAMSPVSRMGAAAPVDLAERSDSADDLARRLAELAELRGRNPDFATAAALDAQVLTVLAPGADPADVPAGVVTESDDVLALSADQALDGGYVDLVEPGLNGVLERLSGYEVTVGGQARTLAIDGETAQIRFNSLGLVARILHTVANPALAYLLLIGGALALAFEIFQPGFGVAGMSGLALAGLGLYGLTALPVNWLAFALVVLGLALLVVDVAIAGFGALTAGGALALGVGSFLLFDGPPVLRPSPWIVGLVVAFTLAYFVVILTTVLRAQGSQAITGAEALVGQRGVVRSMLNPEGHVYVRGALWRARAPEDAGRVKTGTPVRVLGLNDGLTLEVEPLDERADSSMESRAQEAAP